MGTCVPPSPSLSGKGLGLEAFAFHREPVFYQAQSWGKGSAARLSQAAEIPTTCQESHPLCFQIDQPTLGMPSREYYFSDGNNQRVSKGPQGPCQMQLPSHILAPTVAWHSCLSTSHARCNQPGKHLCQALSTGDTNTDTQFSHRVSPEVSELIWTDSPLNLAHPCLSLICKVCSCICERSQLWSSLRWSG